MLRRVMPGLLDMTRIVAFDDEAQTEIEQFRQEIIERTGDPGQAECLSDQDPLREVLNTVGVERRLADSTSRAVSVLMLTERWDARSATRIISVRCRRSASLRTGGRPRPAPPVPRSERRESFNVEYAHVLGIAFDVTAELAVAKQQKPRETVAGTSMSPERDACEISGSRVFKATASNCPKSTWTQTLDAFSSRTYSSWTRKDEQFRMRQWGI